MKPTMLSPRSFLLALTMVGITIALVSWDLKKSPGRYRQAVNDTTPKTKTGDREKKIRDLDDVLNELNNVDMKVEMEKAQKEVTEAMKNFDGEKLRLDIEKAMKDVDFDKISKEVKESMAKIDWDKMKKEINESMTKVDWEKMRKEVDESMAKLDWDKMKKEIDESMTKIDWEKMKKDIEEVKNVNLDKLNIDMKKVDEELKKLGPQMEKAKIEIEKAKAEVKDYKDFVDGLQNDGLINKKEGYTIKHKDGELIVNGKKVSSEVYSKYRAFLEKHKVFRIKKTDDDFDIDMD
jgi:hypothetical protein